jgi:hypothetical protein
MRVECSLTHRGDGAQMRCAFEGAAGGAFIQSDLRMILYFPGRAEGKP